MHTGIDSKIERLQESKRRARATRARCGRRRQPDDDRRGQRWPACRRRPSRWCSTTSARRAALRRHAPAGARGGARSSAIRCRATRRPAGRAVGVDASSASSPTRSPPTPGARMQLEAVRERAWENGLTVTAGVSHGDAELEAALLRSMLAGAAGRPDLRHDPHARASGPLPEFREVPTVLLNCSVPDHSLASVVPARSSAATSRRCHLIRAGHRRIAHIHGQSWTDPARDRHHAAIAGRWPSTTSSTTPPSSGRATGSRRRCAARCCRSRRRGRCPARRPADLFEHSPAAHFRTGAAGCQPARRRRTAHFSDGQVVWPR